MNTNNTNLKNSSIRYYTEYIKHFFPKGKTNKYYALITFKLGSELKEEYEKKIAELGLDDLPFDYECDKWYTDKINFFINGTEALNNYSKTKDVAQLLSTDSKKELAEDMANIYINMNDESWRIKNLYPYI